MTQHKKWTAKTKKCVEVLAGLAEEKLIYLAGIIDGEGTISFRKMAKGYYRPILEIVNTDDLLINWLSQIFWQKPTEAKNGKGRRYLRVHLTGFGISPFLDRLEPYLVCKKLQSSLVRRYIQLRKAQRWKESPSPLMIEIVRDVHRLNAVGEDSSKIKHSVRQKYEQAS